MNLRKIIIASIAACFAFTSSAQSYKSEKDIHNRLRNKVINVIGDSYVANHKRPKDETWHSKVAKKYGMTYNNYGRNGGCVAFDRSKDGFGPSLMVRHKNMAKDADVILIIAGHNDARKIGTSEDSLHMFTDSLDTLLRTLKREHPGTRIGYVTPWHVDAEGFAPTIKAIKKVCRKNNVPLLNNYRKKCVIKVRDTKFRAKYFQGHNDTAHLNNAGHDLFLPVGEDFILSLFR